MNCVHVRGFLMKMSDTVGHDIVCFSVHNMNRGRELRFKSSAKYELLDPALTDLLLPPSLNTHQHCSHVK